MLNQNNYLCVWDMYVCMQMNMCMWVCLHMCVHICRSQESMSGVFLSHSSHFLRQALSLNLDLTNFVNMGGQRAPRIYLPPFPSPEMENRYTLSHLTFMTSRNPNSGPSACMVSILPIEPWPWSPFFFTEKVRSTSATHKFHSDKLISMISSRHMKT